jgi:hypothetical protein
MNFIIEEDNILRKWIITLSWDEVAEIIAMKKILYKLLDKAIFSYQMWLGMWNYKDQEKSVYSKIEWFQELKNDIEKLEKTLTDYNRVQAEKDQNK